MSADAAQGNSTSVELAKSLGGMAALNIGLGTMIGAGVFVLPGIAADRVGPAAIISFLVGGVAALSTALSTAELATAMPKCGGGYYFISRALGPVLGSVVGWSLWFGLIFACAFYMASFAAYADGLTPLSGMTVALIVGAGLVVVNLLGAHAAGQVQNLTVGVLLTILVIYLARSLFSVDLELMTPLAPQGWGPVFQTTALLFVGYIGFAEIVCVSEEIKNPDRNLPLALVGSVAAVALVFMLVTFVCVATPGAAALPAGTRVADIARLLMGRAGRGLMIAAGLFGTLAAANSGILAASRVVFAMGRDRLASRWLNEVHARFGVPHRSLVITGAIMLGLIAAGELELLAENAALLHLIMYVLINVAVIVMRGSRVEWYEPGFRMWGFPVVPVLGALACLGVAVQMGATAAAMSGVVVLFALVYYYLACRQRVQLSGAWPEFVCATFLEPAMARMQRHGIAQPGRGPLLVAVKDEGDARDLTQIAVALAAPGSGQLRLFNALELAPDADAGQALDHYGDAIREREAMLEEAVKVAQGYQVSADYSVVLTHHTTLALVSARETLGAEAILLGWPTDDRTPQFASGVASDIWHYGRADVMAFRSTGPLAEVRSILLPYQPGPHFRAAERMATRLAVAWDARISLAVVVPAYLPQPQISALSQEAVGALQYAEQRASPHILASDDPAAALIEDSAHHDLLVMADAAVTPGERRASPQLVAMVAARAVCSALLVRAFTPLQPSAGGESL